MRLIDLKKYNWRWKLMKWLLDIRGAVVTHGGSLPDTSQKSDVYSIIDNATVSSIVDADISASAAIQDSKLAQIVTASKVNVSALTGQIANANLAQLIQAALVSGSALTLLGNIPSTAGIIPAANLPVAASGSGASNGTSFASGVVYQNTQTVKNMIIWIGAGVDSGGWTEINQTAVIGATNSPSTQVASIIMSIPGSSFIDGMSACFFVPAGWYWKINNNAGRVNGTVGTITRIESWQV